MTSIGTRAASGLLAGILTLAGCTSSPPQTAVPSLPERVEYVALGDSAATREGGASVAYPALFATLASRALGVEVQVRNEAVPGSASEELLHSLQASGSLRRQVAEAELITVQTSANDIAPGRDESRARACAARGDLNCFLEILEDTRETLEAILDEILELRDPAETVIRFTDYYNPLPRNPKAAEFGFPRRSRRYVPLLAREWSDTICEVAESEGIPCVRISRAFNGPTGTESPFRKGLLALDGRHLSDAGHELVAQELHALGYAPFT